MTLLKQLCLSKCVRRQSQEDEHVSDMDVGEIGEVHVEIVM
jgi:hypothetical protein